MLCSHTTLFLQKNPRCIQLINSFLPWKPRRCVSHADVAINFSTSSVTRLISKEVRFTSTWIGRRTKTHEFTAFCNVFFFSQEIAILTKLSFKLYIFLQ